MKNIAIGAVVAAIIVFAFQSLSWMALPIHKNTLKFTPNQEAIMSALTANLTEDAVYAFPHPDMDNTTPEQQQAIHEAAIGKPWAIISYHKSMSGEMGGMMLRGFLLNFVAAFILAYFMWTMRDKLTGFGSKLTFALAFAVFTIFQSSLMMANWWETPWHYLSGEIIDQVLGWALAGSWLAWWLGRRQAVAQAA